MSPLEFLGYRAIRSIRQVHYTANGQLTLKPSAQETPENGKEVRQNAHEGSLIRYSQPILFTNAYGARSDSAPPRLHVHYPSLTRNEKRQIRTSPDVLAGLRLLPSRSVRLLPLESLGVSDLRGRGATTDA